MKRVVCLFFIFVFACSVVFGQLHVCNDGLDNDFVEGQPSDGRDALVYDFGAGESRSVIIVEEKFQSDPFEYADLFSIVSSSPNLACLWYAKSLLEEEQDPNNVFWFFDTDDGLDPSYETCMVSLDGKVFSSSALVQAKLDFEFEETDDCAGQLEIVFENYDAVTGDLVSEYAVEADVFKDVKEGDPSGGLKNGSKGDGGHIAILSKSRNLHFYDEEISDYHLESMSAPIHCRENSDTLETLTASIDSENGVITASFDGDSITYDFSEDVGFGAYDYTKIRFIGAMGSKEEQDAVDLHIDNIEVTGRVFVNTASTVCNDGIDNDNPADGLFDYCKEDNSDTCDPGCSSPYDASEEPYDVTCIRPNLGAEEIVYECRDGEDNEGDELKDIEDPGCWYGDSSDYYVPTIKDEGRSPSEKINYWADMHGNRIDGQTVDFGDWLRFISDSDLGYSILRDEEPEPYWVNTFDRSVFKWKTNSEGNDFSPGDHIIFWSLSGFSDNYVVYSDTEDDEPLVVEILPVDSGFVPVGVEKTISIFISDPDDFVEATLYINNEEVKSFDSFDGVYDVDKDGLVFDIPYIFEIDGDYQIKVVVTEENRGIEKSDFLNVIALDTSKTEDAFYVSSCISSPAPNEQISGAIVSFDGSCSSGYYYNYIEEDGGSYEVRQILPLDLHFSWKFYQRGVELAGKCIGDGDKTCDGDDAVYDSVSGDLIESTYKFKRSFATLNQNSVSLEVSIPQELIDGIASGDIDSNDFRVISTR